KLRRDLDERASKLGADDMLARALRSSSSKTDEYRRKIVATKEGGMITGEERLREFLADLYGNVVDYEGRPSKTQVERTDALAHELADVTHDFEGWMTKELADENAKLTGMKLDPITPLTRDEWERN